MNVLVLAVVLWEEGLSEFVFVDFLEDILPDGDAGSVADDGVDSAAGTEDGPSVGVLNPVLIGDFGRGVDGLAVVAAADCASFDGVPVFVGSLPCEGVVLFVFFLAHCVLSFREDTFIIRFFTSG